MSPREPDLVPRQCASLVPVRIGIRTTCGHELVDSGRIQPAEQLHGGIVGLDVVHARSSREHHRVEWLSQHARKSQCIHRGAQLYDGSTMVGVSDFVKEEAPTERGALRTNFDGQKQTSKQRCEGGICRGPRSRLTQRKEWQSYK